MNKTIFFIFFSILNVFFSQTKDSIDLQLKYDENNHIIEVDQDIIYQNSTKESLGKIELCNWINAYKNRSTPLLRRQLDDRKTKMYFAEKEILGECLSLELISDNINLESNINDEILKIKFKNELESGKSIKISIKYRIKLPQADFTNYGYTKEDVLIKNFFIVPASFFKNKKTPYYLNIEEKQFIGHWKIDASSVKNFKISSNLNEVSTHVFEGDLLQDAILYFTNKNKYTRDYIIDNQIIKIEIPMIVNSNEALEMEFYLPLQLKFLKDKLGKLPSKIYIDPISYKTKDFFGIEDFKIPIFNKNISYFDFSEQVDLNYFSRISHQVVQESFNMEINKNHWFYNGTKTYLELEYLEKHYKNRKLIGDLEKKFSILGFNPLSWLSISKLKLSDRYFYTYQYILSQNLDQKLLEYKADLSNFNQIAISHFLAGKTFFWLSKNQFSDRFNNILREFLYKNQNTETNVDEFLTFLASENKKTMFLKDWFSVKNRLNIKLKNINIENSQYNLILKNNTKYELPILLEIEKNKDKSYLNLIAKPNTTSIKLDSTEADLFRLNPNFNLMEENFLDNQLNSKGWFSNFRKIKLKLYTDIPNANLYQIFITPQLNFNAYDNVLLGLSASNSTLFQQKFTYRITPYYSFGTKNLKGSSSLQYQWMPAESFFRNWTIGALGSYFNYDKDLSYKKINIYTSLLFSKNYRQNDGHSIGFSYNFFDRDLNPQTQNQFYNTYDLYNFNYQFGDAGSIHEKFFKTNYQWMNDFQKISVDAFYRWEFAPRKKIAIRFFYGAFVQNQTKTQLFNFGTSTLTNYNFSYNLLGQSAQSGIFSQQYVMAEGGFKSNFRALVGQWITSTNVDAHLWKMLNVYADFGVYKNRLQNPIFIFDTGIKLKIIPDFFEIFLPIHSSLGFEPSFKDYAYRIRYSLNLNLSSVISYFRRGVY